MFRLDADDDCLIEILYDEQQPKREAIEAASTEISLQALLDSYNPRTIRLMGSIGGREVFVLIDRESTRCFI